MKFEIKSDLPKTTQNEIDRISALAAGARTTQEANFLTALAPYLTNAIITTDSSGLIIRATGVTVPTGYPGFKKGAFFVKSDATLNGLYANIGDENSATWNLIDESDTVRSGTPVNAVNATVVLTSDNTNVSDGDTVTVGSQVYRFKNTIAQINDVLIGADADASLTNLKKAINGEAGAGTNYYTGTPVNTNVSCGVVSSHTVTLTALTAGTAANSIATTETSSHLSFATATLLGGVDGTVALTAFEMYADASYLYIASAANTVSGKNWRRIALGSAY